MRALTSKDGDLLSHFDNIKEKNTLANFKCTPFEKMLIDKHTEPANKVKIKGHFPLEHIFGFCETFKKITKNLGFHLTLKTIDRQNSIFTTIATDFNVTINSLYLFVPAIIPNADTQVMFNDSVKSNYTITYGSWYTKRKLSTDGNDFQVDIGNAQHVISSKCLFGSFQTADRIAAPVKNRIGIFNNVNVFKNFCEIDCYRYPKDAVLTFFPETHYMDQYRDLKIIYKEFVGETLMNPFISYTGMKNKYPIQVITLGHQVEHVTPRSSTV